MNADWIPVESSNLKAVRFNEGTQELDIEFHKGEGYYRYEGVDPKHYNYLISKSGDGLGWYFWRVFRNSYPFKKMEFDDRSKETPVS